MVQHARDVADILARGLLGGAQNQIKVLRSLEPEPERAEPLDQAAPQHRHVANEVLRQDERRVPVRT